MVSALALMTTHSVRNILNVPLDLGKQYPDISADKPQVFASLVSAVFLATEADVFSCLASVVTGRVRGSGTGI
jgi:hypothetical protein